MNARNIFVSMIAISAVVWSCAVKNEPDVIETSEREDVDGSIFDEGNEFTLQIRGIVDETVDPDTKTTITEEGSVFHSAWVNGNQIRVDVDGFTKKTGTYDSSTGLFTCSIKELSEGSHTVNAAYPLSVGTASSTKYSFTVPVNQTMPGINAIDESADFLVAKTETINVDASGKISTLDMNFRRAVAIVKIVPVDGTTDPAKSLSARKIKKITVTSGANIPTKIKITPGAEDDSAETNATVFSVSYSGDDFAFSASTSGTDGAYVVFAPSKFTGGKSLRFDIETDDDTYVISKTIASLPDDITFGANQLRPITVTFTDANVEIVTPTPEIVPVAPSKLDYDTTSGSFTFTVDNSDGSTPSATVTSGGSWLSLAEPAITESEGVYTVHFTCTTNDEPGAEERNGVITVSYTGAISQTVDVTQGINLGDVTVNTYWLYFDNTNGNSLVNTSSYFTASNSDSYITFAVGDNCGAASFVVEGKTCTRGLKFDSGKYVDFTTNSSATSVKVSFYYACRKSSNNDTANIKITPTSPVGEAQEFGSYAAFGTASSQRNLSLNKGTTYRIERGSTAKEQALILVKVEEIIPN